jgi:hypothetical protein
MSVFNDIKEIEVKSHGFQYEGYKGMVISPSGLRNLYDNPMMWKKNVILKEKTFLGNANTVFGSLCHQYAEEYYAGRLNKDMSMPKNVIEAVLRSNNNFPISEIDLDYLSLVCTSFRQEYLELHPTPDEIEGYIEYDISDDIKIAGSYDALVKNKDGTYTVIDYKTANKSVTDINAYALQMSVYATLLQINRDIVVSTIRAVVIVKNKAPKIIVLEAKPNIEFANKSISLAISKIELATQYPEIIDMIFTENPFSFTCESKIIEDTTVLDNNALTLRRVKKDIFG